MRQMTRRRIKHHLFQGSVLLCGGIGVAALGAMVLFLLAGAWPALREQGPLGMLLSPGWEPASGRFGLAWMLCATIAASCGAALLALPVAVLSAACIRSLLPRRMRAPLCALLELMSGLPSVMLGLIGLMVLLPALSRLFPRRMGSSGGATLLAAILILAVMLLPELILTLLDDLEGVGRQVDRDARALGATPMQTVFRAQLPAARGKILEAGLDGMRRAAAEGVAVLLVSGNVVRFPALFGGVRTLASGMILEMGYASGVHRSALFSMALLLLLITLLLGRLARRRNG